MPRVMRHADGGPHRFCDDVRLDGNRRRKRIDEAEMVAIAISGDALPRMTGQRSREGLLRSVGDRHQQRVDLSAGQAIRPESVTATTWPTAS